MAFFQLILGYIFLSSTCWILPATADEHPTAAWNVTAREIYQFPNGTWLENIAVRPNGNLLVTSLYTPEVWEINPFLPQLANSTRLVRHFDGYEGAYGISEISDDVFVVGIDNTLWRMDFRNNSASQIATIEDSLLNGITALPSPSTRILVSDSSGGVIWAVDTETGFYEIVHADETMFPNRDIGPLLGVNGIHYLDGYLYYVNTPRRLYCRVAIDTTTGKPTGPYEIIAQGTLADDFAINSDSVAYLAGQVENVVTRVFLNGTAEVVAGNRNSSVVAGGTSAAFGRTSLDSGVVYVSTGGASLAPVNGTYIEGGKVVALYVE